MINSCNQALGALFSCWREPTIGDRDDPSKDWCVVKAYKYTRDGKNNIGLREYHLEKSTEDLYGTRNEDNVLDKPYIISLKAVSILVGTFLYAPTVMAANLCKIAVDISSVFWRVLPNLYKDFCTKSPLTALGNAFLSVIYVIPSAIGESLWRIARTPLYALAMIFASGYTIFQPLEGRKWIGKIELDWHQVDSRNWDLRYEYSGPQEDGFWTTCIRWIKKIPEGKILFLAYCMQRQGNLYEKNTNRTRRFVDNKPWVNKEGLA
ncbi:MAG: hypothetical protein KR126chlam1_00393 [Chlamydiae bacterium]|nr:hypothetical protein [Chlamydiota bacterium]